MELVHTAGALVIPAVNNISHELCWTAQATAEMGFATRAGSRESVNNQCITKGSQNMEV